ncbi:MAG: hypothetical protein JJT96_20800 [Opitutales bacterium]|nr:hypothetical protein [Opitutales bacterium]
MGSRYSLIFSESAATTQGDLPKERCLPLLYDLRHLAEDPFIRSDYTMTNPDERLVNYLLIEDMVVGYFLDHAVGQVRILDLTDVS